MALLDFIKYRDGRMPERQQPSATTLSLTEKGNPIAPLESTNWKLDEGGRCLTRQNIGHSKEGFHGGVEVIWKDGKENAYWTNARPDKESAAMAAGQLYSAWHRGERIRGHKAEKQPESNNPKTIKRPRPSWER